MKARTKLRKSPRFLSATLLVTLSTGGAAQAQSASTCAPSPGGLHAQRIHDEAARGMPSFVRFVKRTQSVFQLDVATEIAKLDAEREAAEACEASAVANVNARPGATVAIASSVDR